jgi:hypothetical protein
VLQLSSLLLQLNLMSAQLERDLLLSRQIQALAVVLEPL